MGRNPLEKWSSHHSQQKSLKCSTWMQSKNKTKQNKTKQNRMISIHFQGKPFSTMVIQVYAPTSNTEESEVEQFYEDVQDL